MTAAIRRQLYVPLAKVPLTRHETDVELSQILEDKYRVHVAAKSLLDEVYEAQHEACDTCASERIEVRYDIDPGVVRVAPCRDCRKADYAAFMAQLAREAEEACPVTQRSGYTDLDPWELPESELNPPTVPEEKSRYVADRAAWDPLDDKQDLLPWTRTTKW